MRTMGDLSARATNPGDLTLSVAKLGLLEPRLLGNEPLRCSLPGCTEFHTAAELRTRLQQHLREGDARAAVVVSTAPFLVAAYSDDLDAAVLLRFSDELAVAHGARPGQRLLTINCYQRFQHPRTGEALFAVDLVLTKGRFWSNVLPYVADFLSDDVEWLAAHKASITETEWSRLDEVTRVRIDQLGAETARPGGPLHHAMPIIVPGSTMPFRTASGAPVPMTLLEPVSETKIAIAIGVVGAMLAAAAWWLVR